MKKVLCIALALMMIAGIFTGCQQPQQEQQTQQTTTDAAQEPSTVNFAVLAPIPGNYAVLGKAFEVATKMAAD